MKKLIVLLAVAATLAGCSGKKTEAVQTDVRVLTKTATAVEKDVELTEEFTSEIQAWKENDITPAASGVHIDRILVDVGSHVKEGQLLVTLDPTQYNQQKVQLQTIENDYNRLLPVYKAGGISQQQIEQAKAQLDVQREVVDNLHKNTQVLSPITGVVTARNSEPGDLFMNAPILHVMQINPLKVIVHISEQFFRDVRLDMPVELRVDLFPDRTFEGFVSRIHPALDPATRTFTVEVRVPNQSEVLRPGMYTRTIFNMGKKPGVLVPDIAVMKQMGSAERYIYVIEDSMAVRRAVKIGRQVGNDVDILSGLKPGEQVAITALSRLSDGTPVEVKNN